MQYDRTVIASVTLLDDQDVLCEGLQLKGTVGENPCRKLWFIAPPVLFDILTDPFSSSSASSSPFFLFSPISPDRNPNHFDHLQFLALPHRHEKEIDPVHFCRIFIFPPLRSSHKPAPPPNPRLGSDHMAPNSRTPSSPGGGGAKKVLGLCPEPPRINFEPRVRRR